MKKIRQFCELKQDEYLDLLSIKVHSAKEADAVFRWIQFRTNWPILSFLYGVFKEVVFTIVARSI